MDYICNSHDCLLSNTKTAKLQYQKTLAAFQWTTINLYDLSVLTVIYANPGHACSHIRPGIYDYLPVNTVHVD